MGTTETWISFTSEGQDSSTAFANGNNQTNNSDLEAVQSGDPYRSKLPWKVDVGLATYMIFIALVSILLNSLVLGTIAGRKRKLVSLEIFIVNLSVIDLLHALLAHPLMVTAALKHGWPFGRTACHCYSATVFFLGTSSISTLATMSVMRYLKVCHSQLDKYMSNRHCLASLLLVYLNAGLWAITPLLGWASYGPEPFGLSCTIDWFRPSISYTICIFLVVYIIPLGSIAFSYGNMVHAIWKAQANMSLFRTKMDGYLTKMSVVMCGCFVLAWTPYAIISFMYTFWPQTQVPHLLAVAAPFFAKSSTCYNPIVYFLCIKRFRKDASAVFFPLFLKKTSKDSSNMEVTQREITEMNQWKEPCPNPLHTLKAGERNLTSKSLMDLHASQQPLLPDKIPRNDETLFGT